MSSGMNAKITWTGLSLGCMIRPLSSRLAGRQIAERTILQGQDVLVAPALQAELSMRIPMLSN